LHAQCTQRWILNIDDDEVPSAALLGSLGELLATREITHWWLPRRWLFKGVDTCLDEPPWVPDYQLRLYRNDAESLRFSDEFHRPVVASGAAGFARAPLWHLDCLVSAPHARRQKALRYERERRGMRVAGLSHNTAFYLPELRPDARTMSLPPEDSELVREVLQGDVDGGVPRCAVRRSHAAEIERLWPGVQEGAKHWTGRITPLHDLPRLIAGAEHTVSVVVENRSPVTWLRGSEASPLLQIGSRWLDATGAAGEEGIHTPLPSDLEPGRELVMPAHVRAPVETGRYRLILDIVHEGVRWFGDAVELDVEVIAAERIGVIGRGAAHDAALDALLLRPSVEAVLVARAEATPGALPSAPGLAGYLLSGLEGPMTPTVAARLVARAAKVLRQARRLRRERPSAPLGRDADEALRSLAGFERVAVVSPDWEPGAAPTRELLRLATTVTAARRLGVPVDVERDAFPEAPDLVDRLLLRAIRG
jgi:hypothetical protein